MMDLSAFREIFQDHTPTLLNHRGCSAVLVPLVEQNGALHLLYEVRSASVSQPGEVCFPGGRMEPGETPIDCALRETNEELGIPPAAIEVIAPLDFLYVRGDRLLYPILAKIDSSALSEMHPVADEVADTFLVPLSWLQEHPPTFYRHRQNVEVPDFPYDEVGVSPDYHWVKHFMEIPIYHGLPHHLWGMTARITYYLLQSIKERNGSD